MPSHTPVLLAECLEALHLQPHGVYVDGTFGRGGHSAAILQALGAEGRLIAFDQDPEAVAVAQTWADPRFRIEHANFDQLLARLGENSVDGLLLDFGVSSPQLDEAERGFSFMRDGPLDMRMNPTVGESAAEWLNRAEESDIADVIYRYGEERQSRRIAKRIVEARPLSRTLQLAEAIARTMPRDRIHPATRSFQAIRIHINQELAVIERVLAQSLRVLKPQGRLAVISFHSLEDRLVKQFIKDHADKRTAVNKYAAQESIATQPLREIARIHASEAERSQNPRARSAVLRVAERTECRL
jgi:16S rRNA (cytosine1402-N4)-methyltransferase